MGRIPSDLRRRNYAVRGRERSGQSADDLEHLVQYSNHAAGLSALQDMKIQGNAHPGEKKMRPGEPIPNRRITKKSI